jgi:hypothetical protein
VQAAVCLQQPWPWGGTFRRPAPALCMLCGGVLLCLCLIDCIERSSSARGLVSGCFGWSELEEFPSPLVCIGLVRPLFGPPVTTSTERSHMLGTQWMLVLEASTPSQGRRTDTI